MVATSPVTGGATPLSLQAPNVLWRVAGSVFLLLLIQTPSGPRCRDETTRSTVIGSADSLTPMSVESIPAAGPLAATKVPPYERNSATLPLGLTSASPSGSPF